VADVPVLTRGREREVQGRLHGRRAGGAECTVPGVPATATASTRRAHLNLLDISMITQANPSCCVLRACARARMAGLAQTGAEADGSCVLVVQEKYL
jgi:hypothetical protein